MTAPLFRLCGLTMEHEQHPNADESICSGQPSPAGPVDGPVETLAQLLGALPSPRPWALPSLTDKLADELADAIADFVGHLNGVHAISDQELVPGCWPLHPGLVHDLAALYAGWVEIHQGLGGTAERAMYWHQRWLPGFYDRLPRLLGGKMTGCTVSLHREGWRPAAARLEEAAKMPDGADPRTAIAEARVNPAHLSTEG